MIGVALCVSMCVSMCVSILKKGVSMAMNFSTTDQIVSPAQVWAHLSLDLQGHVVRLLAQLTALLVLTEEEQIQRTRKEASDVFSSITQQDSA
jgi:hypothetical protein